MKNEALEIIKNITGYDELVIGGEDNEVTVNTGRDKKKYLWYVDENFNIAVNIETGEVLTEEEIESILA